MNHFLKTVFSLLAILILVAGSYILLVKYSTRPEANQFSGNLIGIEGNNLVVKGFYLNNDIQIGNEGQKEVRVRVDSSTAISREAFTVPDTNKVFYPKDLVKDVSVVDMSKIAEDSKVSTLGLLITAEPNIYKKNQFTAVKISYRVPVFSKSR